jgi:DNA-binding response OmpR family regulator
MKIILVAEDDKFLANAYRVKLTKAGFEPHIARDGQEAIDALQSLKPDLILLDLVMPVKDGFATLEEIKKNDATKSLPVIVASNLGQKEDIERAQKLGATDFIIKSDLSLDALVTKIHTILKD